MSQDAAVDFAEFVSREKAQSAPEDYDPVKERDEWLNRLNELYQQIEEFLATYKGNGVEIIYANEELNEEGIGSYLALKMMIRIGRKEIVLTPVGTLLIGAKGRVDVVGPVGKARLVLVDRDATGPSTKVTISVGGKNKVPSPANAPHAISWAWKIATSPPLIRYYELTQDSLFQALLEVANA